MKNYQIILIIILMQSQDQPLIAELKNLSLDESLRSQIDQFLAMTFQKHQLPQLSNAILSNNIPQVHYGTIGIRKLLSQAQNPPIQQVLNLNLMPTFIQMVKQQTYPQLQLEATWILTNIASGQSCQSVIDPTYIPIFINLLRSKNNQIIEQAIWLIGNLAGDSIFFRDIIIKSEGAYVLSQICQNNCQQKTLKICIWALSNLCRGRPKPVYHLIRPAIIILHRAILQQWDQATLAECLWDIQNHAGEQYQLKQLIEANLVPRLIQFLSSKYTQIVVSSIRILGHITTGPDEYSNFLVDNGILDYLEKLLDNTKSAVRREVCWVLSNLIYVNKIVMGKESLLAKLLSLFQKDQTSVQTEIAVIFGNLIDNGEPSSIFTLYQNASIVKYYINLLQNQDQHLLLNIIGALSNFLKYGKNYAVEGKNIFILQIEKYQGVGLLQKLQYNKSEKVYQSVVKLLQDYYPIEQQ